MLIFNLFIVTFTIINNIVVNNFFIFSEKSSGYPRKSLDSICKDNLNMKYEPYCPAMCHFGINKQSKNLVLILQNLAN